MTKATCHCGAVSLSVDDTPAVLTDCNCSACRRYGGLWAYYAPAQVRIDAAADAIEAYVWGDRTLAFNRCRTCGCLTHWSPLDGAAERMGVNARLMPPDVVANARIRHLDGAASWEFLD
jgi:hypothetical protein